MSSPWLSVVIPTYNGARYIADALRSVACQGGTDIELVVVDDGSTDATLEVVRGFEGRLPLRIVTPGRIGNWVTMTNIGLREARAEWASLLHQDDLWLPRRLERIRAEVRDATGALVLHDAEFVGPDQRPLGRWRCPLRAGTVQRSDFLERLLVQNFIAIPSPVFRKEAVLATGGMDERLWYTADWDLWLRLGAMGPVRFVAEALAGFRIHAESQTLGRAVRDGEMEAQLTTVLERHRGVLQASHRSRARVIAAARASIAVNAALAGASRGERIPWGTLLRTVAQLAAAGGAWRYARDSRIVERVLARLRARRG